MPALDTTIPLWIKGTHELEQAWIDAWIETGDVTLAREAVRSHASYGTYFAGNQRDDGTVRITEEQYQSVIEGYQNVLISVGLNPSIFADSFANLIENDVDVSEFTDRVEAVRAGIIDRAPSVVEYYATNFGIEMNEEAVFASLLDPTVSERIIDKTIAISQIGAAAAEHGFALGLTEADVLFQEDLDIIAARRFFGQAEAMLPTLQVLSARHADPDDDFDLNEFTQAQILRDPIQARRIRRLLAQDRSSFAGAVSGGVIAQTQTGRKVGLEAR